tara:strand:+ start:12500 stop:13153 length:654 start_codon:yes stop_codon:yes gene_type:complete
MQKKKLLDSIASYLPDNLSEDVIMKVAKLITKTVDARVQEETETLTRKTFAFVRGNIEKLKEQAVKELELENDTFRNAQLFETVRSVFAIENTPQDELNGFEALASIGEQQEEQNKALVTHVDKLIKENVKLKRQNKVQADTTKKLEESLVRVKGKVSKIQETSKAERNLSDQALVVSQETFNVKADSEKLEESHAPNGNEWIVPSVIEKTLKDLRG